MKGEVLAKALRPKSFDRVIGQDSLIARLRKQMKKRVPAAMMFVGPKGSGKTTISRIIAVSLQCKHALLFGNPCLKCRRRRLSFDIVETNASKVNKKDEIARVIEGADYEPHPGSIYRVYIFDEFQQTSDEAQDMMLKVLEDSPKTAVFMFNTTRPQKIDPMLQSRCLTYQVRALEYDGIKALVQRGLKYVESKLSAEALAEALVEKQVTSGRLVMNAVEQYVAGAPPEEAALVDVSGEVDTHKICRNLIKGDWVSISKALFETSPENARGVRLSVAKYLHSILLSEVEIGSRGKAVASCIRELTTLPPMENSAQLFATSAALYKMCEVFSKYKF